jgi:DNA polymerase-3 subunit alpha
MFLGKTYQEFGPTLVGDSIIVLKGRVSLRDDGMNLHAVSMFSPDLGAGVNHGPLVLQMPEHRATTDTVTELAAVLGRHSGRTEVRLRLLKGDNARTFEIPMPVDITADLFGELKSLLGPGCLV